MTGLNCLSNGSPSSMFRFIGPAMPPYQPATVIWRARYRQQSGYYTCFFWGPRGDFTGEGYWGAHPYPVDPPDGSTHRFEIAIAGEDVPVGQVVDDNGNSIIVEKNRWYTHALRIRAQGNDLLADFFYDLPNTNRIISFTATDDLLIFNPTVPRALTFLDAPWSPGNEMMSGIMRGIRYYDFAHTTPNILAASRCETDAQVLDLGLQSLWYLNMDPAPADISDKSGAGHNPAWVGGNRPLLYQGTHIVSTTSPIIIPAGRQLLGGRIIFPSPSPMVETEYQIQISRDGTSWRPAMGAAIHGGLAPRRRTLDIHHGTSEPARSFEISHDGSAVQARAQIMTSEVHTTQLEMD